MKALLYTSDPHEPSGVIGLFETEEQKRAIIQGFIASLDRYSDTRWNMSWQKWQIASDAAKRAEHQKRIDYEVNALREVEIPIGVYGQYY